MPSTSSSSVLFCSAAGPLRGFGHLVRCGVLADALGVRREIALRGSLDTLHTAVALGWTVHSRSSHLVADLMPDMVVIDEPSTTDALEWVRQARAVGIPSVSIHDLGLGRVASDVSIDGSIARLRGTRAADLQGPQFAILDPSTPLWRGRQLARERGRVLVALGGGSHVRTTGVRLAAEIREVAPHARVDLAVGFAAPEWRPELPAGCRWLKSPGELRRALATTSAAVVAGGITLYEACALGTPVVALAVVPEQRPTIQAFEAAGAAIDATSANLERTIGRAAVHIADLLASPSSAAALGHRAERVVDGKGTARVVRHLRAILASERTGERRHAA